MRISDWSSDVCSSDLIVLHWFTGTKSEAKRALELGCYFSINAGMLGNEKHAPMMQTIPLDRMLTETDGPFTRAGDRPSQPADVAGVVGALGRLHGLPATNCAKLVSDKLRALPGEWGINGVRVECGKGDVWGNGGTD